MVIYEIDCLTKCEEKCAGPQVERLAAVTAQEVVTLGPPDLQCPRREERQTDDGAYASENHPEGFEERHILLVADEGEVDGCYYGHHQVAYDGVGRHRLAVGTEHTADDGHRRRDGTEHSYQHSLGNDATGTEPFQYKVGTEADGDLEQHKPNVEPAHTQTLDVHCRKGEEQDSEDDVWHQKTEHRAPAVQQQAKNNGDRQYVASVFLHFFLWVKTWICSCESLF